MLSIGGCLNKAKLICRSAKVCPWGSASIKVRSLNLVQINNKSLTLKIIILGAGQVGRTAAYHLAKQEANDVTVVDLSPALLRDLQDRLDIRTIVGNGANPSVLEQAGAADADMLVALTNSDEVNMVACQVAWTLFQTRTKIARIRCQDYTRQEALFFNTSFPPEDVSRAGLPVDAYISPEDVVTRYIERLIQYSGALQVLNFADGKVRLVGIKALQGGPLVGQQLRNLKQHLPDVDSRVVAIYREGAGIVPEGSTIIQHGDEVFFLAETNDMRKVMTELRRVDDSVKRVTIVGGGNIGFRLAQRLEKKYRVKLIENNPVRAKHISEVLSDTVVLNGDAADEELLVEENIDNTDVFCAVTNVEETNILSAMLARRLGAHRVMALINRPAYAEIMEKGNLDVAISPQSITMGSLLKHVRRGDIVQVHSLRNGAAEAMETVAHGIKGGKLIGRRIEELDLPPGASVGAVVRGDEVIMGHHGITIERDDHLILFLTDRRQVNAVEKLLQ
jgi:trk system potassium uptake protein